MPSAENEECPRDCPFRDTRHVHGMRMYEPRAVQNVVDLDSILHKAAVAMQERFAPTGARDPRWDARSIAMYRERFAVGLQAVENDIRRNERARIIDWMRKCAQLSATPFIIGEAVHAMADELERRPIT